MDEPVDDPVDDEPVDDDPVDRPRLGLRYAALSDVGQVRKDNQDSAFASEHLLVVADGVGGAARGDVASSTAVQALRRLDGPAPADLLEALAGAIHRAHDRIAEQVEHDPALDGTSTTVTSALFDGARLGVAHVGDSRGYLLREGTLSQLTRDHTFVQSLVDEGRITEEESRTHPHRNLILRAVDGVHETDPDLFYVDLAPGDRILLCSDGASGVLDSGRLADILGTGTVDFAVVELVRAALDAGSSDNVTVVVADVEEAGTEPRPGGFVVVGAAEEQPRAAGHTSKSFFRGHRGGDTGEIEPVPADPDAETSSADPEELRYAPRPPHRGRWPRRLAVLLVLILIAAVAGFFGYRWSQQQYYVAASGDQVAIYRGVQADVPGIRMHHVAEVSDVTIASLTDAYSEQVDAGIPADSLSDAHNIVNRLTKLARVCPTPQPTPTASPKASPSSKATGSAKSSKKQQQQKASASRSPSKTPTRTPSPSPTLKPPDCIETQSSGGQS
jgi:serine/threonine protein phosphatase PrpC